jgi:hypothetical protein
VTRRRPAPGRAIAAGTLLAASLGQRVCTESNRPGDRFVATLGSEVTGPGGATLPAGTPVVLELSRATADPPTVEFLVRGVSLGGEFVPVVADASPVTGEAERRQVVDRRGSGTGKAVQGAGGGRHPRPRARWERQGRGDRGGGGARRPVPSWGAAARTRKRA